MNGATRWVEAVLMLAALVLPVLALLTPLGLAVELAVGAALVTAAFSFVVPALPPLRRIITIVAAAGLFGTISAFWAIDHFRTLAGTGRFVLTAMSGILLIAAASRLPAASARRCALVLTVAWATVQAILLANAVFKLALPLPGATDGHPDNRTFTIVALAAWPVAALTARFWSVRVMTAILALAVLSALTGATEAAIVATLSGLAFLGLAWLWPRNTFLCARIGLVAAIAVAPLLATLIPTQDVTQEWNGISNSAHHRLVIWRFAGQRIAEKPMLGWGFDASRTVPGADEELVSMRRRGIPDTAAPYPVAEPQLPLHPHSMALQVWLELGLPGAVLLAATLWLLLAKVEQAVAPTSVRAALGGGIVAAAIVAMLSFGFWQGWWQGALWLLAMFGGLALVTEKDTL
jgi:O-antigen ligase